MWSRPGEPYGVCRVEPEHVTAAARAAAPAPGRAPQFGDGRICRTIAGAHCLAIPPKEAHRDPIIGSALTTGADG
jgi:hypothetical protein